MAVVLSARRTGTRVVCRGLRLCSGTCGRLLVTGLRRVIRNDRSQTKEERSYWGA